MHLNIKNDLGQLLCPSCGFPNYTKSAPYPPEGDGAAGYGICCCCFFEPGFDDSSDASGDIITNRLDLIREYRSKWANSFTWKCDKHPRPRNFNGKKQLETLLSLAPHLR